VIKKKRARGEESGGGTVMRGWSEGGAARKDDALSERARDSATEQQQPKQRGRGRGRGRGSDQSSNNEAIRRAFFHSKQHKKTEETPHFFIPF